MCVLIHSTCVLIHSTCVLIHSMCVLIHSACVLIHFMCVLMHYVCPHTLCMCPHTLCMCPHSLYMCADRIVDVRRGGHAASSIHVYMSPHTLHMCVSAYTTYTCLYVGQAVHDMRPHTMCTMYMCPHTPYTGICVAYTIYTRICVDRPQICVTAYTVYVCSYAHTQILEAEAGEALTLSVLCSIHESVCMQYTCIYVCIH